MNQWVIWDVKGDFKDSMPPGWEPPFPLVGHAPADAASHILVFAAAPVAISAAAELQERRPDVTVAVWAWRLAEDHVVRIRSVAPVVHGLFTPEHLEAAVDAWHPDEELDRITEVCFAVEEFYGLTSLN